MKTISRLAVALAVAVAAAACPATPSQPTVGERRHQHEPPPPPDPEPDPDPAGPLAAEGEPCTDGSECESGVCEGPGCDQGACAPAQRACTRDLRPYCGCDGKTFRTSGTCPGRLYAHRGECSAKNPVGAECLTGDDCASGVCEGQGCGDDQPGHCKSRDRMCTTDLVPYCGCDGKTFRGSSGCPGRRYRSRNEC